MTLADVALSCLVVVLVGVLVGAAAETIRLLRWGPRVVAVAIVLGGVGSIALVVSTRRRVQTPPSGGLAVEPPDLGAPICPPPGQLEERGQLLAGGRDVYAGEPLADGCGPEATWEATECHVGKP